MLDLTNTDRASSREGNVEKGGRERQGPAEMRRDTWGWTSETCLFLFPPSFNFDAAGNLWEKMDLHHRAKDTPDPKAGEAARSCRSQKRWGELLAWGRGGGPLPGAAGSLGPALASCHRAPAALGPCARAARAAGHTLKFQEQNRIAASLLPSKPHRTFSFCSV